MRSSRSATDPLAPGWAGFAHRGRHGPYPFVENGLDAFAAALDSGAGIECDVRLTADGRLVVFHDSDTARICGTSRIVERSTLADLQSLDVGGHPMPTLDALLALVDGRTPILVEAKFTGFGNRWYRALRAALGDYHGRIGVMSFDSGLLGWIRHKLPDVRRGLVVSDRRGAFGRWWDMCIARPDFLAVDLAAIHRPWVAAARSAMPVYCWTVRTAADRAFAQPFADALIWEADGRP